MKYFIFIVFVIAIVGGVSSCSNDDECPIPNTACSDNECTCETGYFMSSDGNTCLPYVTEYNGACSEDAQCDWLGENSYCDYACRCKEGFRWYMGKCQAYVGLGEDCSESTDCFDGYNFLSLTCDNSKCVCSEGYYQRGDTDCRKISSIENNNTCALDLDCQDEDVGTVCILGKCVPPTDSLQALRLMEEEEEEETIEFYGALPEQLCQSDTDCEGIANSECYPKTGKCVCKKQYFASNEGTCIAELGVDVGCVNDSDCVLRPGKCVNGACYCRDYWFIDEGNRNCIKTMSQNNWNCLSKEWCYALGKYSYCSSDEKCECSKLAELNETTSLCKWNGQTDPNLCTDDFQCKHIQNGFCVDQTCGCKKNYVLSGNRCVPDIGAACDDTIKCEITDSSCVDSVCQCNDGFVAYEKKECYRKSTGLGYDCEVDVQCSATVTYSKCQNLTCGCEDDRLAYSNTCVRKSEYGSYCNNLLECSLSLSVDSIQCRNHKCQCPTGHSWSDGECSSSSAVIGNLFMIVAILLLKSVFSFS